jgi:hypothetical protein
MAMSDQDFYAGFEGEPEIRFVLKRDAKVLRTLRAWIGYFDTIMRKVSPEAEGWTALAREYHTDLGWSEDPPWRVPDVPAAVAQWAGVDLSDLDETARAFHRALLELLNSADQPGLELFIESD